jgi:5-methylcytosine-specific restriction endonuclease McrA
MAILMGANTRTYKFALGHALLELAGTGRERASLADLAVPYSLAMADHAIRAKQAPRTESLGEADFLRILSEEAEMTLATGVPTSRLVEAAVRSMPTMVMTKFHNLRGTGGVPHRFYEIAGPPGRREVSFTSALRDLSSSSHARTLGHELGSRWALVESAFDADIGRSLIRDGVVLSVDGEAVLDRVRRAPVARSRSSLVGFQHGRCFYCAVPLDDLEVDVHVDHLFPFSLMTTGAWDGPDLNAVWNLVVACAPCNLAKSNRLPTETEVQRLIHRNEAVIGSPHPLRRTLILMLGTSEEQRLTYYHAIDALARWK